MKAIRVRQYGGPEQLLLEDIERPQPRVGEYLVEVQGAGVISTDVQTRMGYFDGLMGIHLPYTPGWDYSGVVVERGPGATLLEVGQAVFGFLPGQGSYAEYLTAQDSMIAPRPVNVTSVEAAAVPLAASTAYKCLVETAQIEAGQTVLITGAAGGVGSFAVQFARRLGVRVIAVASADKHDFVRQLGADVTIASNELGRTSGDLRADVILDSIGPGAEADMLPALAPGGKFLRISGDPASVGTLLERGVNATFVGTEPKRERLEAIGLWLSLGSLCVPIDKTLPLEQASEAHTLLERREVKGKIVLSMQHESDRTNSPT